MKNAYYFSHDSNARNDQKILEIRAKYGMEGYGIFFGIIEMLREANAYQLPTKFDSIAFGLGVEVHKVRHIIEGFGLFIIKGDHFFSESLKSRMKKYDNVSKKRSESGRLGGLAKSQAIAKQMPSTKIKENKVKEKKGKEIEDSKTKTWAKPTVQEVEDYCRERSNRVDPHKFWNYYESNGWRVGRNQMKNWKAAIITWERNSGGYDGRQRTDGAGGGSTQNKTGAAPGKFAGVGEEITL